MLDSTTALTLASNPLPAGRVALLSQSGNMALELSQLPRRRAGTGSPGSRRSGNQADLGVADLIRSCTEHPGTDLIAVYCEDFGDGRAFVDAAAAGGRGRQAGCIADGRWQRGLDPRRPVAHRGR